MKLRRWRRKIVANVRYLLALSSRFRITFVMASLLFGVGPLLVWWRYPLASGERITYGAAFNHVYFLVYAQATLPYVDDWLLRLLNMLVPPLGLVGLIDSGVRFAYVYFSKHRGDKEWISVVTRSLVGHVVVCGAGRIGYRVANELLSLGQDVVVIEKRDDAPFVNVLRDRDVPVLIDDIKSQQCLSRVNIQKAGAIVCATDDDLANLNVALDARRIHPEIRVVIRLFDDDLVARVRTAFHAEALSSSALAGPPMALTALDPRILHSFRVGEQLLVVSLFRVGKGLEELTIGALHSRFGALVLALQRSGAKEKEQLTPAPETQLRPGDVLTLQARYEDYRRLRAFTGETTAPRSMA